MGDLQAIAGIPDHKEKQARYLSSLEERIASGNHASLRGFLEHVLSEDVPMMVSKPLVAAFAESLPRLSDETLRAVSQDALQLLQPRLGTFEEQAAKVREAMAGSLERSEDYVGAARMLAGIDLESRSRHASNEYKLATYVRIAMLFLEDSDSVSAETYIKRASPLAAGTGDKGLELQYKTCYARILDHKRKFLEAATRYYELSQAPAALVSGDDRRQALDAAASCAILAGAGPQRSRVLAQLCKDERCAELAVHSLLVKVFLGRLLTQADVEGFRARLAPHQLASLGDGSTVLDRAATEHNLQAVSKLYSNISFEQLGELLGVLPGRAESIAARMIAEGRLEGHVDQQENVIVFRRELPLQRWDARIHSLCTRANATVEIISRAQPNEA